MTERQLDLERVYKAILAAEYIADSQNQKRIRRDKYDPHMAKIWGHLWNAKGILINYLGYYQPTLPMYIDKCRRNKTSTSWLDRGSKRAQQIFEICQRAKKAGQVQKTNNIRKV